MKKVNIPLNEAQLNMILQSLGGQPYAVVADLIEYLRIQAVTQLNKDKEKEQDDEAEENQDDEGAGAGEDDTQANTVRPIRTKAKKARQA